MTEIPGRLLALGRWCVVAGSACGLIATYWDDAWHTVRGRDSTFIPPHLLLYASILLVGLVLIGWIVLTFLRTRSVRVVLATPGLVLAVAAGAVTAGAAPIDALWHAAYGRDSVLWSPPHLLSVVGTTTLLIAALLGFGRGGSYRLRIALSVILLGAGQIVVLEYDTNVPQFSEVLYLPLVMLTGLGTAWIVRSLVGGQYVVSSVVCVYQLLRVAVLIALSAQGWLAPDYPLALLGLVVLDEPKRLGVLRWPLAGLAMVALQLVASATGLSSVRFDSVVIAAIAITSVLVLATVLVILPRKATSVATAIVALVGTPLWTAQPARAHDPGQGSELGTAELVISGDGAGKLSVFVRDIEGIALGSVEPVRLVARRAGQTLTADLMSNEAPAGRRAYAGLVEVPSAGLWFVYAELRAGSRSAETWLAVSHDTKGPIVRRRAIYEPAGAGQRPVGEYIAGAVLFAVVAALIAWAAMSVRQARWRPVVDAEPAEHVDDSAPVVSEEVDERT